jgi:sugar lactone lactonase YvrE
MGHVFISYSRADRDYVQRLAAVIASIGIECWFDYEITSGDRWTEIIKERIETCDLMVVVMSPASAGSDMVEIEIDLARSRDKLIVPLLLYGDEPLFLLRNKQYHDVRGGKLPPARFLARLIAATQSGTQRPVPIEPVLMHALGISKFGNALAWRDDNHLAISGMDLEIRSGTVTVWVVSTGEKVQSFTGPANTVTGVGYSPDRSLLAGSSLDGTVHLWDADTGATVRVLPGQGELSALAYSPDGRHIATAGPDRTAVVWDVASGTITHTLSWRGWFADVAFSPNSTLLAAASNEGAAVLFDAGTGATVRVLAGHNGNVLGVAFSADGRRVATTGSDDTRVWDVATGECLRAVTDGPHHESQSDVDISPEGAYFATGGNQGVTRIWDIASGVMLSRLTGHTTYMSEVSYSPDGTHLATSASDGTALIWRVADTG